jgi:ribosomal protein L11 methyltransferase
MFVWRKRAGAGWLAANEMALRGIAGRRLVIVSKPQSKNTIAEIAVKKRSDLESIRSRFGGTIEKLPRNWLREFLRGNTVQPIKIGARLLITSSGGLQTGVYNKSAGGKTPLLVIPAGAAFGTGEHATTAMSLRLLERISRKGEFSLLDLGTGSGILALAAVRFGAKRVIAIDNDPIAIATAKENARRNRIDNIDFQVASVVRGALPRQIDIVMANLFSELLIEILPKLKPARWLVLSGVLRDQEADLRRALRQNGIAIVERRRRGKWIAILAQPIQGHLERKRRTSPILVDRTM